MSLPRREHGRLTLRHPRSRVRADIVGILVCSWLATAASAQLDAKVHQATTQPTDGRFELVQSPLAARWTFLLDRYTGHVDQMVESIFGSMIWQQMPVIDLPETADADEPRFVLFTSGIAARHTFLMDSRTGKTWMLMTLSATEEEPEEGVGWTPLLE